MAATTVFLNHGNSSRRKLNDLRFPPESKNGRVPQSVSSFKRPLMEKISVGNMAIIASGNFAMAAMLPAGIGGAHDMAIYTCLG
jgi:hypothetical protein